MTADPTRLTLDQARAALERHVRTTRWGRRGIAATLPIDGLEASGAHHVRFESFTESRVVAPAHEPYRGGPVDGPENGPAPAMWDIAVTQPALFTPEVAHYRVPHTCEVRTCHVCGGGGRVTCSPCSGSGRVTCSGCGGSGSVSRTRSVTHTDANGQSHHHTEFYTESCSGCGGGGRVSCSNCGGDGRVTCGTCSGAGRLMHYQRMTVTWKHHADDTVLESTELPDALIADAEGIAVLQEESARIEATSGTGDAAAGAFRAAPLRVRGDVDKACNGLIARHAFSGAKLHRQRLTVRAVPVYEARYRWGKEARRFWVYGLDQRVHAPRFPLSRARLGIAAGAGAAALSGAAALIQSMSAPPSVPALPPPAPVAAPAVMAEPPALAAAPAPTPAVPEFEDAGPSALESGGADASAPHAAARHRHRAR